MNTININGTLFYNEAELTASIPKINNTYILLYWSLIILIFTYVKTKNFNFLLFNLSRYPDIHYELQSNDVYDDKEYRKSLRKRHYRYKKNSTKPVKDYVLQSQFRFEQDHDWSIKLVEDVLIFLRLLQTSKKTTDYAFAAITFSKLRTSKPLIQTKYIENIVNFCSKIFTKDDELELQSIDFNLDTVEGLLDQYSQLREAPIFKKVYKCLMYVLSFSVFEKFGIEFSSFNYNVLEAEALKRKFSSRPDMIHCLLDTLLFLVKRGRAIMHTGRIDVLFHSGNTYGEWSDKVEILKRQSEMLTHPDISGLSNADFLADLDDAIEKGDCIAKYSNIMSQFEKKHMLRTLNDLKMLRFDHVSKRKAKESRDIPFSIMVFSPPKMGKSSIMHNLRVHYAKLRGLRCQKEAVFTRNPIADHWDGYDNSYWGCIFDDVAFLNPSSSTGPDPSISEFLQAINGEAYITKQAELENKGSIAFKSEWCVATTNTINLNAHHYFSCPSAVQRRFPYILIPKVKPEYQDDDGCLDASKVPVPDHYYDYWTYTVQKVISRSNERDLKKYAKMETVMEDADLKEFLCWYTKAIKDHRKVQDKIRESGKKLNDIKLCGNCHLPYAMCECQLQSEDIGGSLFFLRTLFCNFLMILLSYCYIIYKYSRFVRMITETIDNISTIRRYKQRFDEYTNFAIPKFFEKQFWKELGDKVGKTVPGYELALPIIAALTVGYSLSKLNSLRYTLQGIDDSKEYDKNCKKPQIDENIERENVWYKNDYELSSFDVSPMSISYKSMSDDMVHKIIGRNCVSLKFIRDGNMVRYAKATCVTGQLYITNNHNVPEVNVQDLEIIQQSVSEGVNKNIIVKLSSSQVHRYPDRDICFIYIPNIPPKKNIIGLFAKESMQASSVGYYVRRERNGEILNSHLYKISPQKNFSIPQLGIKIPCWSAVSSCSTIIGDCGSVMISKTTYGPVIVGMHTLGSGENVIAAAVTQEYIQNFLDKNTEYNLQSGTPQLSSLSADRKLGSLHKKSTLRYINEGTAAAYGSFKEFRGKPKSRVCLTPIVHEMSALGYKINYTKPEMLSYVPWRIAMLDLTNPVTQLDQNILDKCVKSFGDEILSRLTKERLSQVEKYDMFTAVNGANGVAYVDKMNRNTSAGNPWKKSKKHFIVSIPECHGLSDPVEVTDEIKNRVEHMETEYQSGRCVHPNFCAHLKDEPVTFKKAKAMKTRVFAGAPFDWSIIVRKYLLSAIRVIQSERYTFESAPGTIAQSAEWQEMYEYITKFGTDRIIAGDYKAFDKSMAAQAILSAFEVLIIICKASGNYTVEDIRTIRCMARDVAFSLQDFNGDLVQFFGSNPSGNPLTVIINGLVNALYIRYCYYVLNPKKEVDSFKENVSLITYGDDNIMGISKNIDWLNHTTIQAALSDLGITYTMADKEAVSVPFINISEATFLKRSWRFDEDIGFYLCPLDHDSIEKMLMVWTQSKSICAEEQICAVVSAAVREYFYYGKDVFEQKRNMLMNVMNKEQYIPWIEDSTFPTWEQLKKQFYAASSLTEFGLFPIRR